MGWAPNGSCQFNVHSCWFNENHLLFFCIVPLRAQAELLSQWCCLPTVRHWVGNMTHSVSLTICMGMVISANSNKTGCSVCFLSLSLHLAFQIYFHCEHLVWFVVFLGKSSINSIWHLFCFSIRNLIAHWIHSICVCVCVYVLPEPKPVQTRYFTSHIAFEMPFYLFDSFDFVCFGRLFAFSALIHNFPIIRSFVVPYGSHFWILEFWMDAQNKRHEMILIGPIWNGFSWV